MFIAEVFGLNLLSNKSHARSFPSIYRLFISKPPPGFVGMTILARNFFKRSKRQIVGSSASFPGSQPPPTPSLDASTQPRNSGSPMTNSFAIVCSRAASFRSIFQYLNSCFAAGKSFHQTIRGFTFRNLSIGIIDCFQSMFWEGLNGTPFVMRTILCRSALIKLCLS